MQILDGKKVARAMLQELQTQIETFGVKPKLGIILVGDNPASLGYVRNKIKKCDQIGMEHQLIEFPADATEAAVLEKIRDINQDPLFNGLIVQLPVPSQIDAKHIIEAIDPAKDVDGFHPVNIGKMFLGLSSLVSATPAGIMRLLHEYNIQVAGKNVVIIGRSNIVGKPLSIMMVNQGATVTVCNRSTCDLQAVMRSADILIAAAGSPHLVQAAFVKPAAVVVDVGSTYRDGQLLGDVDPAGLENIASFFAPVPGGVGPMTIAMLLSNTVTAYTMQHPSPASSIPGND